MLINKSVQQQNIETAQTKHFVNPYNILQNISTTHSAKDLTVLIVEDDILSLKIVSELLKKHVGCVYESTNGHDALKIISDTSVKIDIVFSDVSMPIMDGIELVAEITNINQNIPIVLLTGEEDSSVVIKAINLDVYRFIKKPINSSVILKIIDDVARDKFYKTRQENIQMRFSFLWEMVNSFTMITITDHLGNIVFANDAFCELTGYSEKDLFGKTHNIIKHPETPLSRFDAIWSTLLAGDAWRGTLKNKTKHGKDFYVDIIIYPVFSADGSPNGYVGMSHDITARVQSEERAMIEISRSIAILNATPGVVFLTDGLTILHKNEAFGELFPNATTSVKSLVLPNVRLKNMSFDNIDLSLSNWALYVVKYPNTIHLLTVVKNEKELTYYVVTEMVEGGEEFVIVMHDITELEELRNNLEKKVASEILSRQQKEELLARSSRFALMGEMVSMIAHQWRQPLSYISSTVGELQMDLALGNEIQKDALLKYSSEIASTVKHLSATIDDFRDFFKPDKKSEFIKILSLVKQAVAMLEGAVKNIDIEYNFENEDIGVTTYQRELLQVFLNLVKNATDAINENNVHNPKILISSYSDSKFVYILFKDNGGGIPANVIEKIFDPYFSTKGNIGTGLGLYMSQTIISSHCKGKLVVSNEDNGAVFKIILPNN